MDPEFPKRPSVLVLEHEKTGKPIHVLGAFRRDIPRPRCSISLPIGLGKMHETWLNCAQEQKDNLAAGSRSDFVAEGDVHLSGADGGWARTT
jgi:hypothetical protein